MSIQASLAIAIRKNFSQLEVWLQKRPNTNYWEFPGGKIEKNENPLQACLREVLEETKWEVSCDDLHYFKLYQVEGVILHCYLADGRKASDLPKEGWKPLNSDLFKLSLPSNRELIEDLLSWQTDFNPQLLW